ncbi:MAG: DUF5362 family protein [Ferruginibacter sp.]
MDTSQNLLNTEIQVDNVATTHLKETAMWAKFLAIVGFAGSVFIAILAFFLDTILNRNGEINYSIENSTVVKIFYFVVAAVYFFLSFFLFRFAARMKRALLSADQHTFNDSLNNLKLAYRVMGIITIIYLALMVLLVIAIVGASLVSN